MAEKVLMGGFVVLLVILVVKGLWRATAVQKGTGCPICDAHLGVGKPHCHEAGESPAEDGKKV